MDGREGSSSSGIGSMQGACRCHRHHQSSPAPLVIEDIEIPVWVGNCEKWLTGLTKRTTCDDVIYALLCQESSSTAANQSVANYAVFEQWRGVRRPLKGRTKIIKVWRAWGSDSRNVKLFLCELENNMDTSSEVSRNWHQRRRGSRDKSVKGEKPLRDCKKATEGHRNSELKQQGSKYVTLPNPNNNGYSKTVKGSQANEQLDRLKKWKHGRTNSPHRRLDTCIGYVPSSTIVSNAFSKSLNEEKIPLAAMRLKEHAECQELLHVINEQESVIAHQMHQLNETELQIATHEYKSKESKTPEMDTNGSSDNALFPNIKANDMEAYVHICDSILDMQNKIDCELSKIEDLSTSITEESKLQSDNSNCVHPTRENGQRVQEEVESIRRDLKRSVALSVAQQKQLQLVSETLNACEVQLRIKRQHVERLTTEIERLNEDENEQQKDLSADPCSSSSIESGIENSPEPGTKSELPTNRFFQSSSRGYPSEEKTQHGTQVDNYVQISENTDYCQVEITPKANSRPGAHKVNNYENVGPDGQICQTGVKASNLKKGILKTKSQGYSVRFADEVNGNADYVNVDPCLTQVFEYSKYEGHNYVNLDDLDQGCYDDDDLHYDDVDEDTEWIQDQNQAYNVDTGELFYTEPPSCVPEHSNSGMVPYRTYQVRTPDLDIPGVKNNSSDDNSDTGLSSMHSDDPIPSVLETLV